MIGLFETMLVQVRGSRRVCPLLPLHLDRLALGLRLEFGVILDLEAVERALDRGSAGWSTTHVVRLECRVVGGAAVLEARSRDATSASEPLRLVPFTARDTDRRAIAHLKSLEREFWDERERRLATADSEPLAIDDAGLVLESSRGNLLALVGGEFVTPPLDGRILPGIGRATVARALRARGIRVVERLLHRRELQRASLWSTNAVRGPRAAFLDGEPPFAASLVHALLEQVWRDQICGDPRHSLGSDLGPAPRV